MGLALPAHDCSNNWSRSLEHRGVAARAGVPVATVTAETRVLVEEVRVTTRCVEGSDGGVYLRRRLRRERANSAEDG